MSSYRYTCGGAQKELVELVRILRETDVLQATPDEDLLRGCVTPCSPCRKKAKVNSCCGWSTVIERGILSFGPLVHSAGKQIRLELSARCDFRRPAAGRQPDWDAAPLAASVVTLEILSVENDELLERHHLDLANTAPSPQPGPVWHLQMGGKPAGPTPPTATNWLDEPRWPTAPMDLTLAIEFVMYSFFPDKWEQLNKNGAWIRLMKDAEQLVVSHFAAHMEAHFRRNANDRDRTWLTAQDNGSRAYDPRPPRP